MSKDVDRLITELKYGGLFTQKKAAKALANLGKPAVLPLIQLLKDANPGIRGYAASILGTIGNPKAVKPLLHTVQDENPVVRMLAADALGMIGDPRAISALQRILNDQVPYVQIAAQEALMKLQTQKITGHEVDKI
jgi:HEAT repeat protein